MLVHFSPANADSHSSHGTKSGVMENVASGEKKIGLSAGNCARISFRNSRLSGVLKINQSGSNPACREAVGIELGEHFYQNAGWWAAFFFQ